jgi:hypothetical protein
MGVMARPDEPMTGWAIGDPPVSHAPNRFGVHLARSDSAFALSARAADGRAVPNTFP